MQNSTGTSATSTEDAFESGFTRAARHFFLWYRSGPRVGHAALRRVLRSLMARRQRVVLGNGLKMDLDLDKVVQHTIFWYDGDMEPQLSWAVREFLPVGGAFVDCGANCGFIGLEARLRKHALVLFVEPHPELAASIQRNIALNGWKESCKVLQAAASEQEGTAELFICGFYDGSHSLLSDWSGQTGVQQTVKVRTLSLAQLMDTEPGFGRIDFLKIDTEGHDLSVLKGLGERLSPEAIPMLYVELGREREAGLKLIAERGYAGFVYRGGFSSVNLRRAVRQSAVGRNVALFLPLKQCANIAETLWCAKGSANEAFLNELSRHG